MFAPALSLLVALVMGLCSPASTVWAQARCKRLYLSAQKGPAAQKAALFGRASGCFYQAYLSSPSAEQKGRQLWNAILMQRKGLKWAIASRRAIQADVIRQQIVGWCQLYQRKKLAREDREKAKAIARLKSRLGRQIGYASLDVFTGSPSSQVCIRPLSLGPRKPRCTTTRWLSRKQLFAGAYALQVTYLKTTQRRTVRLRRFKRHAECFTPPFSSLIVVTNAPRARITVQREGGESRSASGERKTFDGLVIGAYRVQVKYRHASAQSKRVQVRLGKPAVVSFRPPPPVKVDILTTPPGARVTIDGVPRGKTPLLALPLAVGNHQIRVAKPCFLPRSERLSIQPKTTRLAPIALTRDPLWLARQKLEKQLLQRRKVRDATRLTLLIGGSVLLASSAILIGAGIADNLNRLQDRARDHALYTAKFYGEGQTGTRLNIAGMVVGSVGVGAMLPGLWLQLSRPPRLSADLPCQIPRARPARK